MIFTPASGRALIRQTSAGFITLGVMHFDQDCGFKPEEATGYPLVFDQNGITVSHEQLDSSLSAGYEIDTITEWAELPRWRSSSREMHPLMQVNTVRFTQAFEHGYAFVSVSGEDPFKAFEGIHRPDHSHYIVDIAQGHLLPGPTAGIGTNGSAFNGQALGSLLDGNCIWPDAQGVLHTLPKLTVAGREKFDRLREIDCQLITGSIDASAAAQLRMNLGEMGTSQVQKDSTWREYFKLLVEYGMTSNAGRAQPSEQFLRREDFAKVAVRAIQAGDTDSPELHAKLQLISGNQRTPLEHYTQQPQPDRPATKQASASSPEPF